jgi:hypothetical protein
LFKIGVSAKVIRILQGLYEGAFTNIRMQQGVTGKIPITKGVLQGCVASPLLFKLFISDIIDVVNKSGISGVQIGDRYELHVLLFADDMVLVASSPGSLQLKINVLHKYFEDLGLKINIRRQKP